MYATVQGVISISFLGFFVSAMYRSFAVTPLYSGVCTICTFIVMHSFPACGLSQFGGLVADVDCIY